MAQDEKTRAENRTETAVAESGFEDFRPAFRERLRRLREDKPAAFAAALRYYEDRLLPVVADESSDAVVEWVAYGQRLGELTSAGNTLSIDETGRARPYSEVGSHLLTLHIPNDTSAEVLALLVPRELSRAQRATVELLLNRARALTE
jgi:hypothetical protein